MEARNFDMNYADLLNKSQKYVLAALAEAGVEYRIVEIGGRKMVVTRDHNPKRLNFVIHNDRLVDYTLG